VRRCLFDRIPRGYPFTGLSSAKHAEVPGGCQPIWQDSERRAARMTDPAPHPDALVQVIVGLAKPPSVAGDCVAAAKRTSPREEFQRDHPGSALSFVVGGAIKRITAGVKARR
jgi:hypothetical protein